MVRSRLVLVLGALLCSGCMNADDFLYDAQKKASYHVPGNLPAAEVEAISFPSGGETLYGFLIKPDPAAPPIPYTFLYFHGNKHNIDAYWDDVSRLHATGASVLVFDYRGFGRSTGTSSSEKDFETDADAALAYLTGTGVAPDAICLYGYSLGNVGSLYLAGEALAFRAVVAQGAFASLDSLIQGTAFMPLPDGWTNKNTFDNIAAVEKVHAPLLVLHGLSDETARWEDNGRPLFDHAPEPKRLVLVPGAGHDNLAETMGVPAYEALVQAWVEQPGGS